MDGCLIQLNIEGITPRPNKRQMMAYNIIQHHTKSYNIIQHHTTSYNSQQRTFSSHIPWPKHGFFSIFTIESTDPLMGSLDSSFVFRGRKWSLLESESVNASEVPPLFWVFRRAEKQGWVVARCFNSIKGISLVVSNISYFP